MRRFALAIVMLLTVWLLSGLLPVEGVEVNDISEQDECAWWVSIICEIPVETNEVTYVGIGPDGKNRCYTPYTNDCKWTGKDSQVWSFPVMARN